MNITGKVSDISNSVTKAIAELCQCQYPSSFVVDSQLFCDGKSEVVYQGQLLTADSKTAEEVRNLTQEWVLNKPFISVSDKTYQLIPYCSVNIDKVGESMCDAISPTEPTLKSNKISSAGFTIREISFIVVMGLLVLVIVAFAVSATACFIRRRSKMRRLKLRYVTSFRVHNRKREESVPRTIVYSYHLCTHVHVVS